MFVGAGVDTAQRDAGASTAPRRSTVVDAAEVSRLPGRAARPRCSPSWSGTASPAAVLISTIDRGQGDRRPAGDQDRLRPDHRRRRRPGRRRTGVADHAVGLRRLATPSRRPSPRARRSSRSSRTRLRPRRPPARPPSEAVEVTPPTPPGRPGSPSASPREATGRPELTEAAIVVSGGRGTGGDFSPVEAFADSLGAAVGASPRRGRRRLVPAHQPGRPDRQAGLAAAVRRGRHLRRDPAPGRACRPPRRSSRSTRTRRRRSSSSSTSASSATCSAVLPQATAGGQGRQGLTPRSDHACPAPTAFGSGRRAVRRTGRVPAAPRVGRLRR